MQNRGNKSLLILGIILFLAFMIAGSAGAKSLYVLASHHQRSFQAWDIPAGGTPVSWQGTYSLLYALYPAGVAIHEPSKTLFISSESRNLEVVDAVTFASLGQLPGTQFAGIAVDDSNDILYAIQRSTMMLYAYDFSRTGATWTLIPRPHFPRNLTGLHYRSGMGIALDELSDPPILWVADGGHRMVRAYDTTTWVEDPGLSFSTVSTGIGAVGMGMDRRRGIIYWGSMNYGAGVPPYSGSPNLYKYDLATQTITYQDATVFDTVWNRDGRVVDVSVDEDTGLVYITETSHMSVWDTSTTPWTMLQRHSFITPSVRHPATCGLAVTNVSYQPNLHLGKTDDVADDDCRGVGQIISYTLDYGNVGDTDLSGVTITDTLPMEVDVMPGHGGVYNDTTHTIIWNIGDLAVDASGAISLDVRVNSTAVPDTPIINYAAIQSDQTPPSTVNVNTGICEVESPCCDLDGDTDCDIDDYNWFLRAYGTSSGDSGWIEKADYDGDGLVTLPDFYTWYNCYWQYSSPLN